MTSGTEDELVEVEGRAPVVCSACGQPIVDQFFEINRTVVCEPCRSSIESQLRGGPGWGRIARASLFGIGAASVGTALYSAFLWFSAYDWSILAIGIGYIVGRMVRKGSGGFGGTACQMLAVVLTYGSLGMTYFMVAFLPMIGARLLRIAPDEILEILVFAFQMPVIQMKESPIHIAFVGFALWEAWKLNRPLRVVVTGPHPVGVVEAG